MRPYCKRHSQLPVLLLCVNSKCQQRLLCLRCADSHFRHDLVSIEYFTDHMLHRLQVNSDNPDRKGILKELNSSKEEMLQKLQATRAKVNGLLGMCQDKIEEYYSRLFHSFSTEPHTQLVSRLWKGLSSEMVGELLGHVQSVDKIVLGTKEDTSALIYANMELYRRKLADVATAVTTTVNILSTFLDKMSLARPQTFQCEFSKDKQQRGFFAISDEALSVCRNVGNGGFPLCLTVSPFSPISRKISFRIDREGQGSRSIGLGVCLQEIVRGNNYANCAGFGKGVYAIDQNYGYMSEKMLSSWNHHDTQFNQSHVGNTDLVGWNFKQGDTVTLEVDYYNSMLTFLKGGPQEEEEVEVYEMPIKVDEGAIYPFVSLGCKGDSISVVRL